MNRQADQIEPAVPASGGRPASRRTRNAREADRRMDGSHDGGSFSEKEPLADDLSDDEAAALAAAGKPWLIALSALMGLTASGPQTPFFMWGLRRTRLSWGNLEVLAERLQRDVIFLEFTEPTSADAPNIILVTCGKKGSELHEDCELWAFKHWTKAEILTPRCRFKLNDDNRLKGKANNLDEMRARRVSLTHNRWKALAAEKAKGDLGGWFRIPRELFAPSPPQTEAAATLS
jgi:hypothetical protein